uniref:Peptidase M50 domain-containing protein n=1 Tax=Aureoumbra lagunensis TaxID=44058 RepID=A0A7S3JQP8_9STRA|mmetsp:Transcript_21974/g.33902  ORF Transcript_21974/g.33902 Transcript_21974/m.33902 type:complete len:577 (+) Transcript_21974:50-1780(+)
MLYFFVVVILYVEGLQIPLHENGVRRKKIRMHAEKDWEREAEILNLRAEKLRLEARKDELELAREKREYESKNPSLKTESTTRKIADSVSTDIPKEGSVAEKLDDAETTVLRRLMEEEDDFLELDWLFPSGWLPTGIMNSSYAQQIKAQIPSNAFYVDAVESSSTCAVFRGRVRCAKLSDCYKTCQNALATKFPELMVFLLEDPAAFVDGNEDDDWSNFDTPFRPPLSLVVVASNAGPGNSNDLSSPASVWGLPLIQLDPSENKIAAALLWISSAASLFIFAASAFNSESIDQLITTNSLWPAFLPLITLIVTNTLLHEGAHIFIAKKYNFSGWSAPTPTPSISTGLLGTINSLQAFPKSRSDLMAISLAGPSIGLLFSLLCLFAGAFCFEPPHLNAAIDADLFLPHIPAAAIRSSTIASIILALANPQLATSVVNEATNAQLIVSPIFVAGLASSIINALQLIPIGRTDGSRALGALIGRNAAVAVTAIVTTVVFFNAFFLNDDLLLAHLLIALTFYARTDPPCRDEATEPEAGLANLYAIAVSVAVFVLLPCPLSGLSSPSNVNLPADFPVIFP